MPDASPPTDTPSPGPGRWPWLVLLAAAVWAVGVRVPLVLNAASHLDSDLAVDGLTLLDALRGHWRWHYPGTPYIGIGPVLLSLLQSLALGPTPAALVSGGTVAYLGLMVATFLLAWRTFGSAVACWSLVPLTFASNGAVWLSGRITGGHLVAAAWHAGAFALLAVALQRPGRSTAFALGLWCGVGLYLDSMFAVTLAGLVPALAFGWAANLGLRRSIGLALLAVAGFAAGVWPRPVGAALEPYSAYDEQFSLVGQVDVAAEHAALLVRECLPRLIAGHKLPGLEADPSPETVNGPARRVGASGATASGWAAGATTVALGAWLAASLALAWGAVGHFDRRGRWVAGGLIVSAGLTVAAFVANRHIYNSDNYRYLVTLLVPWALGYGLLAAGLGRRGWGGRVAAAGLALVLAVVMTADLRDWYAGFGWVDARWRPVVSRPEDPVLNWLVADPEVTWIEGGYWDVYRLAFLTGGRVRGAPFPIYPNRFPTWRPAPGEGRALIARPSPEEAPFGARAARSGARRALSARGTTVYRLP